MLNIEGKTPEEVMAGFHSKWRYNIRVAQRHGVECKVCDKSHIDEFYRLMEKTGAPGTALSSVQRNIS